LNSYLSETKLNLQNKTVLVRIDSDVDLVKKNGRLVVDEDFRLKSSLPTIRFLKEKNIKKIIILGHLGRPEGKKTAGLSLTPIKKWFSDNGFDLQFEENLRFNSGEEKNDLRYAKKLASLGDVFVNDAFGASHRKHASVVGIPRFLPSFLGIRFEGEIKVLSWLKKNAPRPLVFVLGGSKEDKLDYLKFLSEWSDFLLIGGKLPLMTKRVTLGSLKTNGKDIDEETTIKFKEIITKGKTVVWAGPMGVYEEKENQKGTFAIAKAIAKNKGFKIAGGGDTHRVLSWLKLWHQFNFVSVGGGAMLYFLRDETLPAIEAVKNQKRV